MTISNGKLKSIFALKVGTADFSTDIVSFDLNSDEADADSQTFAEYNAGANRVWTLSVTAAWDGGSVGSLHDYLWTNAGAQASFEVQPLNGVASADKPRYTGTLRIPTTPNISVEAGSDSTFEYDFELVGEPNKVISGTA
ncbi:hypothetical protein [Rhodococcus erythropolis]|uniref:hypothetical protein n=1 Tax=Rhodococcus erythropolis TaxID=1833 RepID=UPI0008D7143E|nr:hypothetical protein [Rhodococcus erythropolis]OFV75362.1 hypothetical protein RERY_39600 [Rhodococcus erythropolis]